MLFIFPIILLYILCASGFTIAKSALLVTTPFFFAGVRLSIAGFGLLIWFLVKKPSNIRFCSIGLHKQRRIYWHLAQLTLFGTYGMFLCDLWSLQFFSSTESAFIFTFTPFFTALLSWWWFNEVITLRKWVGIGLGLGAGTLFLGGIPAFSPSTVFSLPFAALVLAVFFGAYGWILVRELVQVQSLPIAWVQGISMSFSGVLAVLTSLVFEYAFWSPVPVTSLPWFLYYTVAAMLFVNIAFTNFYSYLLRQYTATLLSFAGFLCPVFVAALGSVFLHEQISVVSVFALLIFSAGLFIFYSEELRQGYYSTPRK